MKKNKYIIHVAGGSQWILHLTKEEADDMYKELRGMLPTITIVDNGQKLTFIKQSITVIQQCVPAKPTHIGF